MLKEILLFLLIIGIGYRLLAQFIFPIFRPPVNDSDRMRRMQDQMDEMSRKMNSSGGKRTFGRKKKDGDYIDYEEVG